MLKKSTFQFLALFIFGSFILFSYLVAKEKFVQLDFDMTVKLQDKIPNSLDFPFSLLSILGQAEITGLIWGTILFYVLFKKYWKTALTLFLLPIALAIEVFGKLFLYHPAPPHLFYRGVIHFDFPSHHVVTNYSYPSGHVTRTAFLIAFFIVWLYFKSPKKYQLIFQPVLTIILILMLISRVSLGEHWPTDVFGGLLLGVSTGILSALTIPKKTYKTT